MKHYSVTAKLWIKVDAQSQEEAESISKNIIDEALYDYVVAHNKVPDPKPGISKAKIIWTKESDQKERTNL